MIESAETVVIERITPILDGGKYPINRAPSENVRVEADIFKDGHDRMTALLKWRPTGSDEWQETAMRPIVNDRWEGTLTVADAGNYDVVIEAWGDTFRSWQDEIAKKIAGGLQDLRSESLEGAAILRGAAARALPESQADARLIESFAARLESADTESLGEIAENTILTGLLAHYADRSLSTTSTPPLPIHVERPRAAYSAWYEFFPRSAEGKADSGSTFRDCLPRIDDARAMGFDVIYFPPIHPIGETNRKGRNNSLHAGPDEPGVPYAIGNFRHGVNGGGHKDVAPELGTLEDFAWLVSEIESRGMEIALDFAINCSPDHPYVKDHPDWFFKRPDGTIKYAENPPKKYEDVYPLNFHCADWESLWAEMRDVLVFWARLGVKIFRVDNPHTKPVSFWAWVIREVHAECPDVIFLSEAFTRPKMMRVLAKIGFTQSYTYFTWRNTKEELTEYLTELSQSEMADYFRGNFFTNTPDILPEYLVTGGRPAFLVRAVLAATLSPLYGIYSGFELCENAKVPGKEEYLESEKYQFKGRDWNAPGNIKDWITALNRARREHRALQSLRTLEFHPCDNDQILFFSKMTESRDDIILCAVNLDPFNTQAGWVDIPLDEACINPDHPYEVRDLLTGERFTWRGPRNFVSLDPRNRPAHVFSVHRLAGRKAGADIFV